MTDTRVYARVTRADLGAWAAASDADLRGQPVHAVTDRARAAFPDDDEEELEYAALWSAAEDAGAAGLSAAGAHAAAGATVVAALDVPAAWVRPSGGEPPRRPGQRRGGRGCFPR